MITKFKIFEKNSYSLMFENIKPEIDEKTITIRSTDNPNFYIDIYVDEDDKVFYIDNPKNLKIPDWIEKKITLKDIQKYFDGFNSYQFGGKKIVYCDYLYKIIAQQKYNL